MNSTSALSPFLLLLNCVWRVDCAEYYGVLNDKVFSSSFGSTTGPNVTKLACTVLCDGRADCDAFNFVPRLGGVDAACEFVKIDANTTAVLKEGAEVWITRSPSSDSGRARLLPDRKVYMMINQYNSSYTDADANCRRMGALAAAGPTSVEKFEAFAAMMKAEPLAVHGAYMGMKDHVLQGVFVDYRGNTYPRSLNFPNETSLLFRGDCLAAWKTTENGSATWRVADTTCNTKRPYFCEFPRQKDAHGIGCFEIPPKPEGAVYQNWDGINLPIQLGTTVVSVCVPGQSFHTGQSTYSTTCQTDGYWSRPSPPVPFCTGTPGYWSSGPKCFKLLQDDVVTGRYAQARCQQMGGIVLAFNSSTKATFKSLLLPAGSNEANKATAFAGYTDEATEGSWKDLQGNPMPLGLWNTDTGEPNGDTSQNHAYVECFSQELPDTRVYDLTDVRAVDVFKSKLICVFNNC